MSLQTCIAFCLPHKKMLSRMFTHEMKAYSDQGLLCSKKDEKHCKNRSHDLISHFLKPCDFVWESEWKSHYPVKIFFSSVALKGADFLKNVSNVFFHSMKVNRVQKPGWDRHGGELMMTQFWQHNYSLPNTQLFLFPEKGYSSLIHVSSLGF